MDSINLENEIKLIDEFKELYKNYLTLNKKSDLRYLTFIYEFFYYDAYNSLKIINNPYSLNDAFNLLFYLTIKEHIINYDLKYKNNEENEYNYKINKEYIEKVEINNELKTLENKIDLITSKYSSLSSSELILYYKGLKYLFNEFNNKDNYPLNLKIIKKINSLILIDYKDNIEYKNYNNVISNGINYINAIDHSKITFYMNYLIESINKEIEEILNNYSNLSLNYNLSNENIISYFRFIARTHANYERIHPFKDGNGRVGRMLIHYINLKLDYLPFIINANHKDEYYNSLNYFNKRVDYIEYPEDGLAIFFLKEYIDNLNLLLDPDNPLFEV